MNKSIFDDFSERVRDAFMDFIIEDMEIEEEAERSYDYTAYRLNLRLRIVTI